MDRSNRYEAAFEAYLQQQGLTYVAVVEKRRTVLHDRPVKNLDFIVCAPDNTWLVIDVKGRRYPSGPPNRVVREMAVQVGGTEGPRLARGACRQQGLIHLYRHWCDARDCSHCSTRTIPLAGRPS